MSFFVCAIVDEMPKDLGETRAKFVEGFARGAESDPQWPQVYTKTTSYVAVVLQGDFTLLPTWQVSC